MKRTPSAAFPPRQREGGSGGRVVADCGDFGIAIARDGTWWHQGTPFTRMALVKLFASVMERDENGTFWLRTPVERGTIAVEDAPFLAVELDAYGEGRDQVLIFRTNIDDSVQAGERHPLRVAHAASGEPSPYVLVRGRLEARLTRPVFYQLVELGCEEEHRGATRFGAWSGGVFFPLDAP